MNTVKPVYKHPMLRYVPMGNKFHGNLNFHFFVHKLHCKAYKKVVLWMTVMIQTSNQNCKKNKEIARYNYSTGLAH